MKTKVENPVVHYSHLITRTMEQLNKTHRRKKEVKTACKTVQKRIALVKTALAKASQTFCTVLKVDVVARYIQKNAPQVEFRIFPDIARWDEDYVPQNPNQRYIMIFLGACLDKIACTESASILIAQFNGSFLQVDEQEFGSASNVPDSLIRELKRLANSDTLVKRIVKALHLPD